MPDFHVRPSDCREISQTMPVTHCIAHEITRFDADQAAKVNYRGEEMPVEEHANQLLEELKSVFTSRTSKRYGQFSDSSADSPLPAWTREYLEGRIPFLTLSKKATELFVEKLESTNEVFYGHLLFVEEETANFRWLHLFHLQHQPGLLINNNLDITETEYADIAHMGFGARINLSLLIENDSEKYVTLSKGRGERAIQDLLADFIGFVDTVDITEDTNEFLNIVEAYSEKMPEDAGQEYKSRVVDYCIEQGKLGEPVVYKELSHYIDEDSPEQFESFAKDQQKEREYTPKEEFIPDRKSLKRYVTYSGRTKDVSLSFAAKLLGEDIQFDRHTETITIKNLPKSLLKQLKEQGLT